jgi:pyrimidine deaminase RibD-like protein
MKISDFQIHDTDRLDAILVDLCDMVIQGHKNDPEGFGMVAAAILDNKNRVIPALNHVVEDSGLHVHAEAAALNKYRDMYGEPEPGCIVITTLSPCSRKESDERDGISCTELINNSPIKKVYCGYMDPTEPDEEPYKHKKFHLRCTRNDKINQLCKKIADTFLNKDED